MLKGKFSKIVILYEIDYTVYTWFIEFILNLVNLDKSLMNY